VTVASAYRIGIPPGWVHIPAGDAQSMVAAVRRQVRKNSGDAWQMAAGGRLQRAVEADNDRRLLDAFTTAGPLPSTEITASVTVSTAEVTVEAGADPDQLLLARLASESGATIVDIDGAVAIRWSPQDTSPDHPDAPAARTLDQQILLARIPGRDDLFLALVLSVITTLVTTETDILDAERVIARALGDVFDAMLTTFRWTDPARRLLRLERDGEHNAARRP
jgi:hypothetical protein